jgi:predicted MPP superfamily phosphohydrolase
MSHRQPAYQFNVLEAMRHRPLERSMMKHHWLSEGIKKMGLAACTCAIYPRFIAPYRFQIVHRAMAFERLPAAFKGYKILHLTDFHAGSTRTSYLRGAIETGMALKPDLIVISGDLIDYSVKGLKELAHVLPALAAPDGVFTIFGNHDYHEYSWRHVGERSAHRAIHKRLVKLVEGSNVTLLRNQMHPIRRGDATLQIVGLDEMWVGHMNPRQAFEKVDPKAPAIVLQHNPDGYPVLKDFPWQWMLCGHSHGGQVDLPLIGPLYVPMANRQWLRGFFTFTNGVDLPRTMYVSTGLGHSTPIRYGVRPEMALFTLA